MEANQEREMITSNWILPFPQKVYNMLKFCEEKGREDIISWMNEGTAFKVHNVAEFEREVLPNYLNTFKYNTFTRALYSYGFTCVRQGREAGIYLHPSFNRNDPMSLLLVKKKKRGTDKASQKHNTTASNNPSIKTVNHRPSNQIPFGGITSVSQHILQFASRPRPPNETCREEDDADTAHPAAAYPILASQVADDLMVVKEALPTGSELVGVFDSIEGDSMVNTTRSYPPASKLISSTHPNTNPIRTSFPEAAAKSSNGLEMLEDIGFVWD